MTEMRGVAINEGYAFRGFMNKQKEPPGAIIGLAGASI